MQPFISNFSPFLHFRGKILHERFSHPKHVRNFVKVMCDASLECSKLSRWSKTSGYWLSHGDIWDFQLKFIASISGEATKSHAKGSAEGKIINLVTTESMKWILYPLVSIEFLCSFRLIVLGENYERNRDSSEMIYSEIICNSVSLLVAIKQADDFSEPFNRQNHSLNIVLI